MDDDDNDDLVAATSEYDSQSDGEGEAEEQCPPMDNLPEGPPLQMQHYTSHTKVEFVFMKVALILSSTGLLIVSPIYVDAINVNSDVYTMIYFTSFVVIVVLFMLQATHKFFSPKWKEIALHRPPLSILNILIVSVVYILAGFMILYAIDRKRVMCHLQDPIKGLLLVLSLLYYFLFCKKMMGLQRIFSTTTIIVGLFVAVDYGLCDEFRCRGYERERRSDDAGSWSWRTHSFWAAIYIMGLALFAAYYTLLDRFIVSSEISENFPTFSKQLLSTVSNLVSFQGSYDSVTPQNRPLLVSRPNTNLKSTLHLVFWIHLFTWIFTNGLYWTNIIPTIGKASSISELMTNTLNGIECHFNTADKCGYTTVSGWIFILMYLCFSLSSVRFLILSQSAVYTVATITSSIPLIGIWWSLFKLSPEGVFSWNPTMSGELICTLLGMPLVLAGLVLLCRSHFEVCQPSAYNSRLPHTTCITSTHLA